MPEISAANNTARHNKAPHPIERRQAAPGLKVTTKAFGVGRRFPIAQKYRED